MNNIKSEALNEQFCQNAESIKTDEVHKKVLRYLEVGFCIAGKNV